MRTQTNFSCLGELKFLNSKRQIACHSEKMLLEDLAMAYQTKA